MFGLGYQYVTGMLSLHNLSMSKGVTYVDYGYEW